MSKEKFRKIKFRAWDKKGQVGMVDNPKLDVVLEDKRYIIMQFTGLKDKNGKEIYEEDIIDSNRYGIFTIEWRHDGFYPFNMPNNVPDEDICEVIGNIYENPELLEELK